MRERLVRELQLTPEQQGKLDAISEEMRPRFMALRDLPEGDRAAQREKISADMRARISAMLDASQRARYQQMVAQAGQGAGAAPGGGAAPSAAGGGPAPAGAASAPRAAGSRAAGTTTAQGAPATQGAAAAPGQGGPLGEFRNRLVSELQLTTDQIAKVDGLFADARPRYMALRDLAAEERPKARDRITADLRARIGDVLTPEQKTRYATMLAEAASRTSTRGRIYLLDAEGKPRAYNVRLGISDGSSTELIVAPNSPQAAELVEGATVVIGTSAPAAGSATSRGPRLSF